MPQISIKNLTKTYQLPNRSLQVLQDVSLDIQAGQTVALVGKSGSGKTTLLNLIAGLDFFDTGSIKVLDKEVCQMKQAQKERFLNTEVGFVFQNFYLVPYLSISQNVALPILFSGVKATKIQPQVDSMLSYVGLLDQKNKFPKQLSGGQIQRVAIARSLISSPKIIFADEPTGNLDEETTNQVLNLLFKINQEQGATLVIVTHDKDIAQRCSRSLLVNNKKVSAL
jgi:putative ABC transport system ATP-binding protein